MLKSQILLEIQKKHKNLSINDIEIILKIFTKKILSSLKEGNKVELRGFGTLSKKDNKEKIVRNPKTNEKIYKMKSYKLHFKIGKILHNKLNPTINLNE
tara:strand:+ start:75 stop:371 length:297 start_codon:yes stop_codon:yes gene_type:complete